MALTKTLFILSALIAPALTAWPDGDAGPFDCVVANQSGATISVLVNTF